MTIEETKQLLAPGQRVELFDFDNTALGGSLYHFVSSFAVSQPLMWKGVAYSPLPIEASGFEVTGQGKLPQPRLRMSNVLLLGSGIINATGDPLGAKVTRWVTFSQYLDGGASADPDQHFIPQVFVVERKSAQTKIFVEFELSSPMDQEGRTLPGRQVLRDTCTHRYRVYDPYTGSFDYSQVTCPWVGSDGQTGGEEGPLLTALDVSTNEPSEDRCGKRLASCRARFGSDPLPFRGFPAVSRIR